MARSHGRYKFNVLRNCQTFFQSGCMIYIPTSSARDFQLFYFLTNAWFDVSNFRHSNEI